MSVDNLTFYIHVGSNYQRDLLSPLLLSLLLEELIDYLFVYYIVHGKIAVICMNC